jgi:hypothetical protein
MYNKRLFKPVAIGEYKTQKTYIPYFSWADYLILHKKAEYFEIKENIIELAGHSLPAYHPQ